MGTTVELSTHLMLKSHKAFMEGARCCVLFAINSHETDWSDWDFPVCEICEKIFAVETVHFVMGNCLNEAAKCQRHKDAWHWRTFWESCGVWNRNWTFWVLCAGETKSSFDSNRFWNQNAEEVIMVVSCFEWEKQTLGRKRFKSLRLLLYS